jgi:hypothetical protein
MHRDDASIWRESVKRRPESFLLASNDKHLFVDEFFEIIEVNVSRLHDELNRNCDLLTVRYID